MERKKSKRVTLENKRFLFFEIGIILTLAATLAAFEWKSYDVDTYIIEYGPATEVLEEVVLNTKINKPEPKLKPIPVTTLLNIVDNNILDLDDIIIDVGDMPSDPIEEYYVPDLPDEPAVQDPVLFAEVLPEFPGGEAARLAYLRDNIHYPKMAVESHISGIVYLSFVIEKDGSITNLEILRGIGGGCDEEAYRVVNAMPKWSPARQSAFPVRLKMNMPVQFTLM